MRQDRWETARGPADFWSAFRRGARPATGPRFRASGRGRCLNRHVCPDESVPALAIIIENLAPREGRALARRRCPFPLGIGKQDLLKAAGRLANWSAT